MKRPPRSRRRTRRAQRVFLDANVLYSAAYLEGSRLEQLWGLERVELISSGYAVEEVKTEPHSRPSRSRRPTERAAAEGSPGPRTSFGFARTLSQSRREGPTYPACGNRGRGGFASHRRPPPLRSSVWKKSARCFDLAAGGLSHRSAEVQRMKLAGLAASTAAAGTRAFTSPCRFPAGLARES